MYKCQGFQKQCEQQIQSNIVVYLGFSPCSWLWTPPSHPEIHPTPIPSAGLLRMLLPIKKKFKITNTNKDEISIQKWKEISKRILIKISYLSRNSLLLRIII